jgi:hypothetical protein
MSDEFQALAAPFPREAVSWRAQTITKDGDKALALAYLDARDVRRRLNEVCGPENWSCEHYDCGGGKLGCRISIKINGEWVSKTDGAGDTQVEAEKGAFSAALKRAAAAWGVGEYLYDLKSPWVPCRAREKNGKKMFDGFTDDPWSYVRGDTKQPPARPTQARKGANGDDLEARMIAAIKGARSIPALDGIKADHGFKADYAKLSEEGKANVSKAGSDQRIQLETAAQESGDHASAA